MPDYGSRIGQAASGAGQGFLIGSSIGGPIGGAIGGGIGFLSGIFSPSASEQQQSAIDRYIEAIERMRTRRLGELSILTAGQSGVAAQDAKRRALAEGRGNQAESYIAPARAGVAAQGQRSSLEVDRFFDTLESEARGQSPDIQPPLSDYLTTLGSAFATRKRNDLLEDYMKGMRGFGGGTSGAQSQGLIDTFRQMTEPGGALFRPN